MNDYNISYYDYKHLNRHDDFIPLMKRITNNYDVFIFATPVYWYAMSGIMKVFFDRLTDLLTIEKDMGRELRNKYMAVISSSNGDHLNDNFWLPFKKSAQYLGMHYLTNFHSIQGENETAKIAMFKNKIETLNSTKI
ncbi:flavodoxin family protein [Tamlana sp. I1]|uniref:flavodoxin family protein n=1 Tax=Tamlana sp. I1 TaxID=2762061 RepID=UPI001E61E4A7|nr:NAD(P)H-dependent oxidoreductase [Tamlana sp. I1]